MKWVGLIIALAAVVPLSIWLRRNPLDAPKLWMVVGFLPFGLAPFHLYIAILSWDWPGYVKGAEFSVLDALALALYLSLPRASRPLPFRFSMALYFIAVLLSALQANVPMAALFYAWQLARMFLVYAVVTRACTNPRVAPALLQGMAAGLFMEAGFAIFQRFVSGELQPGGTFGHENFLGLISHFVVFPFAALLLAGSRGWLPITVPLAGLVVELLTVSRATIGLAGFGYAALFMLSALRRWTSRKALFLLMGASAFAIAAPLALMSFQERFAAHPLQGDEERGAFEAVASMMLSDHPWGVGANHYVVVANVDAYNQRAGIAPQYGNDSANVHNVYWLVAAETGYAGIISFLLLLLRPLSVAFLCGFRNREDPRGDLLLGLGVALLVVYIHSYFEWVFITFQAQYILAMELGLVAGLAEQLGYWRRTGPRRVQLRGGALSIGPRISPRSSVRLELGRNEVLPTNTGRTRQDFIRQAANRPNSPQGQ